MISKKGKDAISIVKKIEEINKKPLLEVKIITGRTHQIRVHLASVGSPIIGDNIYGGKISKEMFLHHYKISFIHPRSLVRAEYVCKKEFKC
jgi:23S rRNA-/tRNA-specific pseudouridylate synthase